MIKNFPFPVIIFGPNGKTHYINFKFTEFSGYVLKEIPTRQAWNKKCFPVSSKRRQPAHTADARMVLGERDLRGRERRIVCSIKPTFFLPIYYLYIFLAFQLALF